MLPWNKNGKLLEALFEELNEIKAHVQKLEKQREFAKVLKELKADIKTDVVNEIDTARISKSIAKVVLEEIKKSKIGIV